MIGGHVFGGGVFPNLQQGALLNQTWGEKMLSSYMALNPEQAKWFNTIEVQSISNRNSLNVPDGTWCYVNDIGNSTSKEYVYFTELGWVDSLIDNKSLLYNGSSGRYAKAELLSRLSEGAYLHTTFGPDGQNKEVCDFVYLVMTLGNIAGRTNIKTGDALRWDRDGSVSSQNNLASYTLGSNKGIITISSTDGWGGLTQFWLYDNQFGGASPMFYFPAIYSFSIRSNKFSGQVPNYPLPTVYTFSIHLNNFSGQCPLYIMPIVRYFYIRNNNLFGSCPLFDFPLIRDINLSSNNFTGSLPLFEFYTATIINFSNNNFTSFEDYVLKLWTDRALYYSDPKTIDLSGGTNAPLLPVGINPYDPDPDAPANSKEAVFLLDRDNNFEFTYNNGIAPINEEDGYVIFALDDGDNTAYAYGYPLFNQKNIIGQFNIISGIVKGLPDYGDKMTWPQVFDLKDNGMDVQCHSYNHINLTTLTFNEIQDNLTTANSEWIANGLAAPEHLVYPGAASNATVKSAAAPLRLTGRISTTTFNYDAMANKDTDLFEINSIRIDNLTAYTLKRAKELIRYAKDNKIAILFHAHGMAETREVADLLPYIAIGQDDLGSLIDFAKSIGINIVTTSALYNVLTS